MIVSSPWQDTSVLDPLSYTVRAETLSDVNSWAPSQPLSPLSKADFVQALRIMGRQRPRSDYQFELGDPESEAIHTAFLRCPLATWVKVFGQPESVHEHRHIEVRKPYGIGHGAFVAATSLAERTVFRSLVADVTMFVNVGCLLVTPMSASIL